MRYALLYIGLAMMSGCASLPSDRFAPTLPPATILRAAPLAGSETPAELPDTDLLALDAAMTDFLARQVDPHADGSRRLEQLLDALMGHGTFQVQYDRETGTAAETFHAGRGNCLSFTNLFVALARRAGINAGYEEVEVPPNWTQEGGNLLVTRHINAFVQIPGMDERVVDFDTRESHAGFERHHVSDARARAHYYSNIGVNRMLAGESGGALQAFRRALGSDSGFAAGWINLGVLFARNGHDDYAEAAYRQALVVDAADLTAMSNLESLYRQQGRLAEADQLARDIADYRLSNPYYRYFLAQQAYQSGSYDVAIGHLRRAVRLKPAEDTFCGLLGLSYYGAQDTGKARRWLREAERLAPDETARRGYQELLEKMRNSR